MGSAPYNANLTFYEPELRTRIERSEDMRCSRHRLEDDDMCSVETTTTDGNSSSENYGRSPGRPALAH